MDLCKWAVFDGWSVCPLLGETTLKAFYLSAPWQIYETMCLLLRVQGSSCSPWGMGYWLIHLSFRPPDPTLLTWALPWPSQNSITSLPRIGFQPGAHLRCISQDVLQGENSWWFSLKKEKKKLFCSRALPCTSTVIYKNLPYKHTWTSAQR
jgi:hypothetical protein